MTKFEAIHKSNSQKFYKMVEQMLKKKKSAEVPRRLISSPRLGFSTVRKTNVQDKIVEYPVSCSLGAHLVYWYFMKL